MKRFLLFILLFGCSTVTRYDDIYIAIQNNDKSDVINHLRKGTPIETKKRGNITPLGYALELKNYEISEMLLKKGAKPNTYLAECFVRHDETGMKLLIEYGADTAGMGKLDNLVQELKNTGYPEEYIIADLRK